jgi:hypothetical protein
MNRFFFTVSILGIIACVTINVLALSGIYVSRSMGFMLFLMLGAGIVFVPAVLKLKKLSKANQQERPKGLKGFRKHNKDTKAIMLSFWKPYPTGLKSLVIVIAVYGFVNFFSMGYLLGEGNAKLENGIYIMQDHGKFVRDITEAEYLQNLAYQSSLFTGHIAIFYAISMLFHYRK